MVPRTASTGQRPNQIDEEGMTWLYELGTPWFGFFVAAIILIISVLVGRF